MSQKYGERTHFCVEEVLGELALDSESDDEPFKFESSDSGWTSDSNVESDANRVVTHTSTSTGQRVTPKILLVYIIIPLSKMVANLFPKQPSFFNNT